MTVNGNSVNIVATGPAHRLKFYWAVNGSPTWHAETVAGAGTAYSAPAIAVNSGAVTIAVAGAKNRLRFFWATNGSPTWHAETVAGPRTTYSAPSITANGNSANISAVGAGQPAEVLLGGQRLADLARGDGRGQGQRALGRTGSSAGVPALLPAGHGPVRACG